jgi:hypothetical protein
MKVRFNCPIGREGWTKDVELSQVPRVGDLIALADGGEVTVRTVVWNPFKVPDYPGDVYVVVK